MSLCWNGLKCGKHCRKSLPLNSLPYHKILDSSELKAFAEEKMKVAQKLKSVYGKVENFVGTGIFSFSHKYFQKASF